VDRDEIERSAADLGVELNAHIQIVLDALKEIAPQLELDGRLAQTP